MKPEANSRRLFGITRSKGKMYELGLPLESHIAVPAGSNPEELLLLTVGTLGDTAAEICVAEDPGHQFEADINEELRFSASFFDAFLAARFSPKLNRDIALMASATYYLASRPGSSLVMSRKITVDENETPCEKIARCLLQANWGEYPENFAPPFGELLSKLAKLVAVHFRDGSGVFEIMETCNRLRYFAYRNANPQNLFLVDIICAVAKRRILSSSWIKLPAFTGIPLTDWSQVIQRNGFPKELWPSQALLGEEGIFSGASGLIQMPTSAGKTRSVEIIIRSSFMSGRTKVAIVIAPFRALVHEIGNSLRDAFRPDDVKVNELSDAFQMDYLEQIDELLGIRGSDSKYVVVMTPEKFLYVLRQTPSLVDSVGLVVYDEGHQFDTGSRGIIYELLLTEIKRLLPVSAQTILISAVIQNAQAIGNWLIGENVKIVSGKDLSPTSRSVAFASWADRLGQLMFYETESLKKSDYFVPRVIEQQKFEKKGRERKARHFPERDNATDISLYLGLRLVGNGAIAIFCGRKDTASKLASRAVEIYSRGLNLPSPATYSDSDELRRLESLYRMHFGELADSTRAANLGVFSHHGNTPHGIRLSVEHAMQQEKIKFVACTSTLAQGVNLPIRYLIVSGVYQGLNKIKVRDFQNLMGRAGRAGIHTEGLVIFADPAIYDSRITENWRFKSASDLLNPDRAEPTSSSLLSILGPLYSPTGIPLEIETDALRNLLLQDEEGWDSWALEMAAANPGSGINARALTNELRRRRRLIFAIESYLMANRGTDAFIEFSQRVTQLTVETLAYSLADDAQKASLEGLFNAIAQYLEGRDPSHEKQAEYAKTVLGIEVAQSIEAWTSENRDSLLSLNSNEDLLTSIWILLAEHSQETFFTSVLPTSLPLQLATMWLQGRSYQDLFVYVGNEGGTKQYGEKRRKLQEADIIEFCEITLGFECPLIIAAVTQFLFGNLIDSDNAASTLLHFHKALKYGIPDTLAISFYESGFADRMLAQVLRDAVLSDGYTGQSFMLAIAQHREKLAATLSDYPSYFESVLSTIA